MLNFINAAVALLCAAMIPLHCLLIYRGYRIADSIKVARALPLMTIVLSSQREADRRAFQTTFVSGAVVIFLICMTIRNYSIYVERY